MTSIIWHCGNHIGQQVFFYAYWPDHVCNTSVKQIIIFHVMLIKNVSRPVLNQCVRSLREDPGASTSFRPIPCQSDSPQRLLSPGWELPIVRRKNGFPRWFPELWNGWRREDGCFTRPCESASFREKVGWIEFCFMIHLGEVPAALLVFICAMSFLEFIWWKWP